MKQQLIPIINELKEIVNKSDLNRVSDDIILQESVNILINYNNKFYPRKQDKPDKTNINPFTKKEEPITPGQRKRLESEDILIHAGMTKKEAWEIINKLEKKKKNGAKNQDNSWRD